MKEPSLRPARHRRVLRLATALFFLTAGSALVPLAAVLLLGWVQLREQLRVWTLPSVEVALADAAASQVATVRVWQRILDDSAREALVSPPPTADSMGWRSRLDGLSASPAVDFAQLYVRDSTGYRLANGSHEPDLSARISDPSDSEIGPAAPILFRVESPRADWLATPAAFWTAGRASNSGPRPDGILVTGMVFPPRTISRMESTARAVQLYRRLGEVGRLLGTAYGAGFALVAGVATLGAVWLARRLSERVSHPLDALARAMSDSDLGRRRIDSSEATFPEIAELREAFAAMRTRLADAEARLREAEQVRGARRTARFVAHEIRNSLTPIQVGIEVLTRRVAGLPTDDRARAEQALALLLRESERMTRLATAFAEYAHLPARRIEEVDLARLAREVASVETPASVRLEFQLPETPLPFRGDRDETERLVRNVVRNAVEALGEGGHIRVVAAADGGDVVLEVHDSGPGMDPETAARIFDPGFTTKEGGSGLGLALVRRTVTERGGAIRVESSPGNGAIVRIRMPADPYPDELDQAAPTETAEASS